MAFEYGALLVLEELENEDRQEGDRLFRRHIRDMQDPFAISENEFIATFRLSKEACLLLINNLVPFMYAGQRVASRIPNNMRILVALNFFAAGGYQRGIGNNLLACVSQPMVSRCIKDVSTVLVRRFLNVWIRFPRNLVQTQELKNGFFVTHRMQDIVGIVDGTHVAIVKPEVDEHVFINRKGYHSINVQIICDARMKIISCFARYPGSSHDSFIWRNSGAGRTMRANFENGNRNTRILGDSGYPCLPWLLVPLPRPQTHQEERYNRNVKRVRSTVERCIGLLKGRFRCLIKDRTLHYAPTNATRIILACAILHNIALHYNVDEPPAILDDIDRDIPHLVNNPQLDIIYRQMGQASRQEYIEDNY